jgi:hypothetical protein
MVMVLVVLLLLQLLQIHQTNHDISMAVET